MRDSIQRLNLFGSRSFIQPIRISILRLALYLIAASSACSLSFLTFSLFRSYSISLSLLRLFVIHSYMRVSRAASHSCLAKEASGPVSRCRPCRISLSTSHMHQPQCSSLSSYLVDSRDLCVVAELAKLASPFSSQNFSTLAGCPTILRFATRRWSFLSVPSRFQFYEIVHQALYKHWLRPNIVNSCSKALVLENIDHRSQMKPHSLELCDLPDAESLQKPFQLKFTHCLPSPIQPSLRYAGPSFEGSLGPDKPW